MPLTTGTTKQQSHTLTETQGKEETLKGKESLGEQQETLREEMACSSSDMSLFPPPLPCFFTPQHYR